LDNQDTNRPRTPLPESQADQDQLREIYLAGGVAARVRMGHLAEALDRPPASVTAAIKRLHEGGYVDYQPYHGAQLTDSGAEAAVELVRHHRLIERFLVEILGYEWDDVHEEADRLEHSFSEKLEYHIAEVLSNPTSDPHGDSIPSADLQAVTDESRALAGVDVGAWVQVVRVRDRDPEMLGYLAEIGLVPGTRLVLVERLPFGGPLVVEYGGRTQPIGIPVAEAVFVTPLASGA
jgi:DtxR family Mn-dependent transcriptional regulator